MTLSTKNSPLLDALARLQRHASAAASTCEPVQVPNVARSATSGMLGVTRATYWARKNGGGYRTARKQFACNQFGCYRPVLPGQQYFDTMEPTLWPATKRICATCAEELV